MSFPGPFDLNIFWSSDRSCWGYGEKLFTPDATVRIDRVWSFSELDNYVHRLLESENQQILHLEYVLVCTYEYGRRGQAPIRDDESMSWIYRGAHLRPALYVEVADEPVQDVGEGTTGGQYEGAGSSGIGGTNEDDDDTEDDVHGNSDEEYVPSDESDDDYSDHDASSVVISIFDDISDMDKSELDEDSDGITMWDGNWQTVRHGVHFANKKETNKLFQENIDEIDKCHSPLATNPMKRYEDYRIHQMGHEVTRFSKRNQKYQVVTYSPPDRPWKGGNIHEVNYAARMCTCNKWQTYRFPCSHALAVARYLRHDPLPLFDSFYSREQWAIQFSGEFNPVLQPWPQATWHLRPDDTLLVHHAGPGRKRVNRKKGLMDYTKKFGNKRVQVCGRCHQEGQNASACVVEKVCARCGGFDHDTFNCAFSHPSSDRTPLNHSYDRYGMHGVPHMQTDDSDDQSAEF
ncbi:OLC1v1000776C1 [Oldenlandia corymbosa var. corymbosa]|uniref:OLC1v1000776C1 n=1 Tax=Oldenlandia corymbosa var. corymbosa TaxID=529605 RepID=A0AAV1D5Y7_OLDCO|nr:OLC1v1000776C1 [Oldenlandia corymbosa var. corymbosa]